VLLIVSAQPGANIIATWIGVRAALPQLKSSISPEIDVSVVCWTEPHRSARCHDIEFTLLISCCW